MKDKPILFSTPMVQAILNGTKTQTRRIIKPQPDNDSCTLLPGDDGCFWMDDDYHKSKEFKPYCQEDQTLWVRETFAEGMATESFGTKPFKKLFYYKASTEELGLDNLPKWKPSIHMPREACRIHLKVNSISAERLHDISEEDAVAEGIKTFNKPTPTYLLYKDYVGSKKEFNSWYKSPVESFRSLWCSINGEDSWKSNPWIWKISFNKE